MVLVEYRGDDAAAAHAVALPKIAALPWYLSRDGERKEHRGQRTPRRRGAAGPRANPEPGFAQRLSRNGGRLLQVRVLPRQASVSDNEDVKALLDVNPA